MLTAADLYALIAANVDGMYAGTVPYDVYGERQGDLWRQAAALGLLDAVSACIRAAEAAGRK